MSSILKALRKVEDDKASLGEGHVDLAHDILRGHYGESKSSGWVLPVIIILAFFLIAGVIWFWLLATPRPVGSSSPVEAPKERMVAPPTLDASQLEHNSGEQNLPVAEKGDEISAINTAPVVRQPSVEPQAAIVIPSLLVEEIVYHPDSASRLAVVNQLPVMEGTSIEGALVEKIYPDRVQFSFQGARFNKFRVSNK